MNETPVESVNASAVQEEVTATLAEEVSKSKELTEVLDQDVPAPVAIPTAIEHQNASWFWSVCSKFASCFKKFKSNFKKKRMWCGLKINKIVF